MSTTELPLRPSAMVNTSQKKTARRPPWRKDPAAKVDLKAAEGPRPVWRQKPAKEPQRPLPPSPLPPSQLPAGRAELAREILRTSVVKNTFVNVPLDVDKEAALPRSNSAPTLNEKEDFPAEVRPHVQAKNCEVAVDEEESVSDTGVGSEVSGEEESSLFSSACSTVGGSSSSPLAAGAGSEEGGLDDSETPPNNALKQALAMGSNVLAHVAQMDAAAVAVCSDTSQAQADSLLAFLCGGRPPPPPPVPAPARLKASAQPWRPGNPFSEQSRRIAAAAVAHLLTLPMTLDAAMVDIRRGWRITVLLRRGDMAQVGCIISMAKTALLNAARQQANAQVIGGCKDPFSAWRSGFSMKVAEMKNQESACWDGFYTGHCLRRGCRWEHPERWDIIQVGVEEESW